MLHGLRLVFLFVAVSAHITQAQAVENNKSFSHFEIGVETISYAENTTIAGNSLNLSQQVVNPVQYSVGYTPLEGDAGFYIQIATTLDALSVQESWDITPFGQVQTNQRKVRWNDLTLLYASQLEYSGFQLVGGVNMVTLSFTRSNFQKSTGAAAFEASIAPTTYVVFPGSITEDSTNLSVMVGVRYDTVFSDALDDSRLQFSLTAGMPMYYKVENSNFPNTTWVEYFQGYDVQSNVGYAFRLYKDFFLSMNVNVSYKQRPETSGLAVTGGTGRIPEVTMYNIRSTLGLEWGF